MRSCLASLLPAVLLLTSCSLFQKKQGNTTKNNESANAAADAAKWSALPGVLDFYDEVQMVQADFTLTIYSGGALASEKKGKYEYKKGESVWRYLNGADQLQRQVECFIDKALVKVPQGGRGTSMKIVGSHEAKYPCVLQALVHYSGALKRNRLDHDGKVFIVNRYLKHRRQIRKVTMVKGGTTMVYLFSGIRFIPMPGQKLPDLSAPVSSAPEHGKTGGAKSKPDTEKGQGVGSDEEAPPL